VLIARLFGASQPTQLSLAPKSVTTPIAMGIAERIGGIPSLTAVLVIVTGILGAVGGRYVFDAMKLRDPAIRGFRHRRRLARHRHRPRLSGQRAKRRLCRAGHGTERCADGLAACHSYSAPDHPARLRVSTNGR
jgi:hypothetical protein